MRQAAKSATPFALAVPICARSSRQHLTVAAAADPTDPPSAQRTRPFRAVGSAPAIFGAHQTVVNDWIEQDRGSRSPSTCERIVSWVGLGWLVSWLACGWLVLVLSVLRLFRGEYRIILQQIRAPPETPGRWLEGLAIHALFQQYKLGVSDILADVTGRNVARSQLILNFKSRLFRVPWC
jgi:hypothetical protein